MVAAAQSTVQSLLFNDTVFESLAYSMANTPGFTNRNSLTSRFQDAILDLTQLKTHPASGLKMLVKLLRGTVTVKTEVNYEFKKCSYKHYKPNNQMCFQTK